MRKKVSYFWYHFGLSSGTIEAIEDTIYNQDYKAFKVYQDKYPENLPDMVLILENGDYRSEPLDEETFNSISYSEHENG